MVGQPTGLFTQLEEIDIDFRVSGLPRAVVNQAENSRVRELVKKIESHLIDKIFKPIYNQVMPTTHSVKIKEDDAGHGQCRAVLVARDNS